MIALDARVLASPITSTRVAHLTLVDEWVSPTRMPVCLARGSTSKVMGASYELEEPWAVGLDGCAGGRLWWWMWRQFKLSVIQRVEQRSVRQWHKPRGRDFWLHGCVFERVRCGSVVIE